MRPGRNSLSLIIWLGASVIGLIALTVITGWLAGDSTLTQIRPSYPPMKFNTALCLLLSAAALFCLERTSLRAACAFGLVPLAISFLSLFQYFGIDLGIDELLVSAAGSGSILHPGRMAPNTGLAIFLGNAAIILSASRAEKIARYRDPLAAIMGSIVLGLGSVTLIGYCSGIEAARTWGSYSGMAVHTALGCMLLGTGIVVFIWKKTADIPNWLPIPVAIGFLIIAASTAEAVRNDENMQFQRDLEAEVNYLTGRCNDRLTAFYLAIDRIANRWMLEGGTPQKLWEGDTQAYIKSYPFLVALEWVDAQSHLKWVVPYEEYKLLVGKTLNTEGTRLDTAELAKSTHISQVTKAVSLIQGGEGFLYMSPLFVKDRYDGLIVAAFRLDSIFQRILINDKRGSFYLTVREGDTVIYTNLPPGTVVDPQWEKIARLNNKSSDWSFTLDPTQAEIDNNMDSLPTLIMIMGGISAFLGALASSLASKWRRDAMTLHRSEEQFRLALDHAPIGMALVSHDGRWLRVNQAISEILGYTAGELTQMDFQAIAHPGDYEKDARRIRQTLAGVIDTYQMEKRYIHKNGQTVYTHQSASLVRDDKGKPNYFIVQIEDVTSRHVAEAERAKLLGIIEESSDFIGTADMEGRLLYHNRGARRLVGLPDDYDLSKRKIEDMHPAWAYKMLAEQAIPAVFKQGSWIGETALRHEDGREIPVSQALSILRDKEGNPLCMATVMRDITEMKKVERMKSEFISMVSHELRTPLTSIRGALGLIVGGVGGSLAPKPLELITIAHKNSERLGHIINDILDIEKLESGRMQMKTVAVEVVPFLKQVVEVNQAYGERYKVQFELRADLKNDHILADADRLMQVFANLLSNAAKYSTPGGQVLIYTQRRPGMIRFHVQDFGTGIPPEFRPRVFEKFAQADNPETRKHVGTGLGLSLTKKFVELMGGQIDFVSDAGVGTTFFFDLPAATPEDISQHSPLQKGTA